MSNHIFAVTNFMQQLSTFHYFPQLPGYVTTNSNIIDGMLPQVISMDPLNPKLIIFEGNIP